MPRLSWGEQFDTPVLLRLTTRVCHSASAVELGESANQRISESAKEELAIRNSQFVIRPFPRNPAKYVMVPGNTVKRHPVIEARIRAIAEYAKTCPFNPVEPGDRSLGVITCGVSYQYAKEVFPTASVLKLGMTWPLPEKLIHDFAASVDRLIVIEELGIVHRGSGQVVGYPVRGQEHLPADRRV